MTLIDFKKELEDLYTAKSEPKAIKALKLKYITFESEGNPNTVKSFKSGTEALYSVVYKMKFLIKQGKTKLEPFDYKVMPLEGQWWADDMDDFISRNKNKWKWKLMVLVPNEITQELFEEVREMVKQKKDNPSLNELKLEEIEDGDAAQIMHIGSYDDETPNIEKLHKFIEEKGFKLSGLHREIYIGDPRKTPPERLKTIIRQPFTS